MHILLHGWFGSELARLRSEDLRERATRSRHRADGRRRSSRRPVPPSSGG